MAIDTRPGAPVPSIAAPTDTSADAFVLPVGLGSASLIVGASDVTLAASREFPATIQVHGSPSRIVRAYDAQRERAIYLIGRAVHPDYRDTEDLLVWCAKTALAQHPQPLRDLLGNFVIVIDDRRAQQVSFVSDALGARPWFVGSHKGQLVAGSDVLKLCRAGLSRGKPNYDAIGSWLRFNFPVNSASVVADYTHIEPGIVSTFNASGSLVERKSYADLEYGSSAGTQDEAIEACFEAISRSVNTQLRDMEEVNLPISGGYDSRLLCAIAAARSSPRLHLATLHTRDYEVEIAQQVATALGLPLEVVRSGRRILDLFDDPFAFTPGGFVTGRNLTSKMARRLPGMPMITGFLGDGTIRGSMLPAGQAYHAKDLPESPIDDLAALAEKRFSYSSHRLHLLHEPIRKRVHERAYASLKTLIGDGQSRGRPLLHTDLFGWQRSYYANIFLQHLSVSEAITPFVNFRTMNCRARFPRECFNGESYPRLFARYFPMLAGIQHSFFAEGRNAPKPRAQVTRHLRRWSAELAAGLVLTDVLSGTRRRHVLSLLPAGLLGEARYQDEVKFLYKLMLFERSLRKHHIDFDWAKL